MKPETTSAILLPLSCLAFILLAGWVALRLDSRAQRMARRVAQVSSPAAAAEPEPRHSIRLARSRRRPLGIAIRRLLRMPGDPDQAAGGSGVLPATAGVGAALGGAWLARLYFSLPVALLLGVAGGLLLVRMLFGMATSRHTDRLRGQMPDMLALLSSAIRAGLPVSEAFRSIAREMPAPTGPVFARIVREIALGVPAHEALMGFAERVRMAEYALLAVTLGVQSQSGGRLAETIQTLAETIRQRLAIVARAKALSGEAKFSAYVLTALPFLGVAMMSAMQPNFLQPLLHDPRGQHLVFIGVVLLGLGQLTMRHLIATATRE